MPLVRVSHVDRARKERHRLRGIGNIIITSARRRLFEASSVVCRQIDRRRRAHRPARARLPLIDSRRIGVGDRRVRVGRAFEIMVEEGLQLFRPPLKSGVAIEGQRSELVAVMVGARMPPWPDHKVKKAAAFIFVLKRLVDRGRSIAVLLVPLPDLEHRRDRQRVRGHPLVDRLARPELGVGGILHQLADERHVFELIFASEVAGRSRFQVLGVIVAGTGWNARSGGRLAGALGQAEFESARAIGAVVKPVVANPAVDHRALRDRRLQRRMRIDLRRERQEAKVGGADRADLAVGLGHILHQPVDGVVGVGALVDPAVVERPGDRPVHHERAFRIVEAADVLLDDDVTVVDELLVHDRKHVDDGQAGGPRGASLGVIRRSRQKNGAVGRALLHEDDGVELGPVAHRHHRLALDEVGLRKDLVVACDDVGSHRSHPLRRSGGGDCKEREERSGGAEQGSVHGARP